MLASIIFALLLAPAGGEPASEPADAIEAVRASTRIAVLAQPVDRSPPKYPGAERRRGKEAWVHVTYCIDEAGETRNISILDSIGGPSFERAAVSAVEQWQFEPALLDSEPSWQSRNQVYITFAISNNEKGASPDFIRQFRKLHRLIDDEKLEEADELFWRVHDDYDLSLYEMSKLWAQRVRIEGLAGDVHKLDLALHRATASKGKWVDKESYVELLALHLQVEAATGHYKAALDAFDELTEAAGESSDEVDSARPLIQRVTELIDSDQVLKVEAQIRTNDECTTCNSSWKFSPVRRAFTLSNVSGNLTSIDVRCDHKRFESEVSDDVEWQLPDGWGDCRVTFYGDPGTTFDVLMLPDARQAIDSTS